MGYLGPPAGGPQRWLGCAIADTGDSSLSCTPPVAPRSPWQTIQQTPPASPRSRNSLAGDTPCSVCRRAPRPPCRRRAGVGAEVGVLCSLEGWVCAVWVRFALSQPRLPYACLLLKEADMVRIPVLCPHCHNTQVSKGGKTKAGQQRCKCQNTTCPREGFQLTLVYTGRAPAIKE